MPYSFFLFLAGLFLTAAAAVSQTSAPTEKKGSPVVALTPKETDEAIALLRANFVHPIAINVSSPGDATTFQNLLAQLHGAVDILPAKSSEETKAPLYHEIVSNHIGYLRLGALTAENLPLLDQATSDFSAGKVDALVVDLRASSQVQNDFDLAAQFAQRFVTRGKTLWTLHQSTGGQDRPSTSNGDAVLQMPIMVLIDRSTAGAAEAVAAALKMDTHTVLIGENSAGRAGEFKEFPLAGGKVLRVAVSEAIAPQGRSLLGEGLKPDVPVTLAPEEKQQIFARSAEGGMTPFVFEKARPHFNEAALIKGTNPELDNRSGRRGEEGAQRDPVLQRAVDIITSIGILAKQ
ncbi:MAG: S41 family peptidase [Verrucomicrobiota bacterium]